MNHFRLGKINDCHYFISIEGTKLDHLLYDVMMRDNSIGVDEFIVGYNETKDHFYVISHVNGNIPKRSLRETILGYCSFILDEEIPIKLMIESNNGIKCLEIKVPEIYERLSVICERIYKDKRININSFTSHKKFSNERTTNNR